MAKVIDIQEKAKQEQRLMDAMRPRYARLFARIHAATFQKLEDFVDEVFSKAPTRAALGVKDNAGNY